MNTTVRTRIAAAMLMALGWSVALAHADEADPKTMVSNDVTAVITNQGCDRGRSTLCRLVISNRGFEHVSSQVWLEWLAVDESGVPDRVARVRVDEISDGGWVLAPARKGGTIDQRGRVRLQATHNHDHSGASDQEVVIEFGQPGKYRLQRYETPKP